MHSKHTHLPPKPTEVMPKNVLSFYLVGWDFRKAGNLLLSLHSERSETNYMRLH